GERYRRWYMGMPARAETDPALRNTTEPVVVFTEIDDRFSVGASPAASAAEARKTLAAERIALTLCSSMTRAELEMIQQELGIDQPFICESGAAILIPEAYFPFDVPCDRRLPGYLVIDFGRPYAEIVTALRETARRLNTAVISLCDQSVEQVA